MLGGEFLLIFAVLLFKMMRKMHEYFRELGKVFILQKILRSGSRRERSMTSKDKLKVSREAEARFNELVKGHEKLLEAIGKL